MSTFVQGNSGSTGGGAGIFLPTLGSIPSAGDVLQFAVVNNSLISAPADSQSNVWVLASGSPSPGAFSVYTTTAKGGGGSYVMSAHSSAVANTFWTLTDYTPTAGFTLHSATYATVICQTSGTFTSPAAGDLAVLVSVNDGGLPAVSGTGVVQREATSLSMSAVGDKLSCASGSNLWGIGTLGCCGGSFYTCALVYSTPPATQPNVLFAADF